MFSWPKSKPVEEQMEILLAAGRNGGWRQLKKDIVEFNELRSQFIEQMENKKDPLYQRHLQRIKKTMTPDEYEKSRLHLYAVCNDRAMNECISVDQMVDVIANVHPLTQLPIPVPEPLYSSITNQLTPNN